MIKFSQIAICIPDEKDHRQKVINAENIFRIGSFSDSLLMKDQDGKESPLLLSFLMGLFEDTEIEYITSRDIDHWHNTPVKKDKPFLSHLGAYLDKEEFIDAVKYFKNMGFKTIHNSISHDHSNKRNGEDRSYHDVVYDTMDEIGFNIKLTRRVM